MFAAALCRLFREIRVSIYSTNIEFCKYKFRFKVGSKPTIEKYTKSTYKKLFNYNFSFSNNGFGDLILNLTMIIFRVGDGIFTNTSTKIPHTCPDHESNSEPPYLEVNA